LRQLERGLPPGTTSPTNVSLHSDGGPLDPAALPSFGERLRVPGVGQVAPPQVSEDGATADFAVTLTGDPSSDAAIDTVGGPLRSAAHAAAPQGTRALVGGGRWCTSTSRTR